MAILLLGGDSRLARRIAARRPFARSVVRHGTADAVTTVVADYAEVPLSAFVGIATVVNCVGTPVGSPATLHAVNHDVAFASATRARAAGCRHFIQVSSLSVYGRAEQIDGMTPVAPVSAYGRSKAAADAALVRAEAAAPTDMQVASMRAEVLGLAGKRPEAMRVLDAAVARAPRDPGVLNSRCWLKATWNIHAESAVADCDAALAVRPANPAVLDSRGFAHLRAGHWDAAIADYDAALKLAPTLAPSLYGRGLAKLRKSQAQSAGLDFRAARAVAPQIDQQFIGYGIAAPDASAHIALAPPHGTLRPVQVAAPLAAIGPRSPVPATVPSPATAPREARYPASPGAIHNP